MRILFLILLITINHICFPQKTKDNTNTLQFFDYVTNAGVICFFIPDAGKSNENIIGSPYLNDDYKKGYMIVDDTLKISGLEFRYNIYKEEMEIHYNNEYKAIYKPERVNYVVFHNDTFIYSDYIHNDEMKKGYLKVITQGKLSLLKKYMCVLLEPNYNNAMSAGIKNYRYSKKEYYVLKKDNNKEKAITFKPGKKQLYKLLPEKKEQLKSYIKKNKIHIKQESGLINLVEYYNTLI